MTARKRETGKGPSRRLRVAGEVPAVVYGKQEKPLSVSINAHEIEKIMSRASGSMTLIDLECEGTKSTALVRDFQADPFRRRLTHVDFQVVGLDDTIEVDIPVRLVGDAKGLKEGGILDQLRRELTVRCVVSNIPSHIEVDVADLDIGDNIHVNDITLPEGVEVPRTTNFTIAAVVPPTKEEVAAPLAAAVPGADAAVAEGAEVAPAEGAAEEKKEE